MKPKKETVSKLEKNAKVDSKKVIITEKVAENFMRDKIEKKRGRPKKDPYLTKIVRQSKTLIETKREDTKRFLAKDPESMFPLLKSVLGEETFEELMENPNHKEFLSLDEVLTVMAEMAEESAKFTIELLEKRAKGTDLNNPLNQESVNTFYAGFQHKYKAKLKEQWANYFLGDEMSEKYMKDKIEKKKAKKGTKVTSARIDKDLLDEFDKEAKNKGLTRSGLLHQRIEEAMNEELNKVSSSEIQQQSFEVEAPSISPLTANKEPYLEWIEIRLKNLTDEKLKNVLLFDHHDQYKDIVEYSSSTFSLGMKEFLRQLSSIQRGKYVIRCFRYNASCDLERFAVKQTNAYITAMYSDLTGRTYKITHLPDHLKKYHHRPFESIADVTTADQDLSFYSNLSLSLEYLMPETEVAIFITVEKIDK